MKKRIPLLVSLGFVLLIALGLATSTFLIFRLQSTVEATKTVDKHVLPLLSPVRSLRINYLEMGQQVSTHLLDYFSQTNYPERLQNKVNLDAEASRNLTLALSSTQSPALRRALLLLREQDEKVTDPLEGEVLRLTEKDPVAARELYLSHYLPALESNIVLADEARREAFVEVRAQEDAVRARAEWAAAWSWLSIILFFILGGSGAIVFTRLVARIARQAEDAARTNKEMVDHSLDIICSIDAAGRFVRVNGACERILGYSTEELRGRPFLALVHPDDLEKTRLVAADIVAGNPAENFETRYLRKDGVVVHIIWAANWSDEKQLMFCVAHDVTARKRAEEALRTSNQRFELVSRATTNVMWDWDLQTNALWWNENFQTAFGYGVAEVGAGIESWTDRVHPGDKPGIVESIHHLIEGTGHLWSGEYRFRKADGSCAAIFDRGYVVRDAQGKAVRMIGAMQDITDRKRLEEAQQKAREAAEAASRAKGEFLANMSHEIRTPMNGILGMTELVLDTGLSRQQREYLGMVRTSGQALLGLINDILDFSKIEAGKLDLEAIPFSLRNCVGVMLKPLGLRADQKGIELVADIPAGVPDHLVGDSMRLRQILLNLTDNAIKFTTRGEVIVRVVNEPTPEGESCLHFSIADTGIGIPPEKQALIFEAFSQADGSTTRNYGGTGLGLAIATQLVRQMGGRLWVESTVGQGTTFHFTARLPVRDTPAPCTKHADPRLLEGLRVLVVDDNEVNRRILHGMLQNWRMQPTVVASGEAGLAELLRASREATPFALVLLDLMMPGMDGFTVAEKIHARPELAGATVMMLSSGMSGGAGTRCGELGVASFLTKPVGQSDLLDAILLALGDFHPADAGAPAPDAGAAGAPLRILLAEDNVINRAVATGMLEKQGHSLVHAANGREAVEAAARETFDVILMDVQMPVMDGFEATRRIREHDEASGRPRTPIVAMTAHAMAGDRERCLAGGMDDYLSKPLDKAGLLKLLERLPGPARLSPVSVAQTHGSGSAPTIQDADGGLAAPAVFTREKLLAQLDGDEELAHQVAALFQENTPRLLEDLRGSITRRAAPGLTGSAHALLSSLGAVGATEAHRLTSSLEELGRRADFAGADALFADLERETRKIYAVLADFTLTHV